MLFTKIHRAETREENAHRTKILCSPFSSFRPKEGPWPRPPRGWTNTSSLAGIFAPATVHNARIRWHGSLFSIARRWGSPNCTTCTAELRRSVREIPPNNGTRGCGTRRLLGRFPQKSTPVGSPQGFPGRRDESCSRFQSTLLRQTRCGLRALSDFFFDTRTLQELPIL